MGSRAQRIDQAAGSNAEEYLRCVGVGRAYMDVNVQRMACAVKEPRHAANVACTGSAGKLKA